jgi:hypothetical protein
MVGIAMPPKADDPWLDPNFLGDRPRAAPGRRQKNYPRPLQIALQRHRATTARLKHLAIFPRKVDFSRFGYHPYLESRLTIQEKWVLATTLNVIRNLVRDDIVEYAFTFGVTLASTTADMPGSSKLMGSILCAKAVRISRII